MRTLTLPCLIVLAIAASTLLSPAPAAAQSGIPEPSAGNSAIRARSDGSYSPPRVTAPTVADLKLALRLIIDRYFTMRWLPTAPFEFSAPADLPARRRLL
jgi:hypothetical protein